MSIQDKVVQMYNKVPYPEYGENALTQNYVISKEFIDMVLGYNGANSKIYYGKTVLEAGCGTGRESMYLALKGAKLTSIDIADKPLATAYEQAKLHNFEKIIKFQKASILDLPFEDNSFDIVLSSGVIHHTSNPELALSELTRVLKPGGYLILYVYNNWAHKISNLRRKIVFLFSGKDIHKRVYYAKKLFPIYTKNQPLATTYDEFAHPHKSEHSINEILSWFKKYKIKYESVYPKFGFRGAFLTYKSKSQFEKTGDFNPIPDRYNLISLMNKATSGLFQFLYGFKAYSGGYRFLGKKRYE